MNLIGELIEVISRRAGLDNVREVGAVLKSCHHGQPDVEPLGDRDADTLDVVGSDLLNFGQLVIAGMKKTTGAGAPDTGARFVHGHSGFNKVGETLGSAGPNDSWGGAGSRSYAEQNTRQQMRTETMADADLEVHRLLFRQAAQVTLGRAVLDDQSNFLAHTSYATLPLRFIPRYGEAAKLAIEMSALQGALGESAGQLYQLHSEVCANATELQQAIGRYSSVADNAELPGGTPDQEPRPELDEPTDPDELRAEEPAARAGGAGGSAPVDADPDGLREPLTAKLNTDTSPVPPAGTSPQDTK